MVTDLQTGAPKQALSAESQAATVEFGILTAACGIYPLDNRSKVVLTGEDRVRWLNGMVTNNVRDLAVDHGLYTFLLNPQGKIQGDFYAFNRGEQIVLDMDRSQAVKLLGIFDHYIVMDDVVVSDGTEGIAAVGVQGPSSRQVLQAAEFLIPELTPLQLARLTWSNFEITLVRAEAWKGEAYEIWSSIGSSPEHSAALMAALTQAGAAPVGMDALRLYRMAAGIPQFGEDIRERDLPQETGQERALHFAKGCYVGQEIVERIRSRGKVHRVFSGFDLTTACAAGDKIQAEGKDVGEITSVASIVLSGHERIIALGYLRREAFTKLLTVSGVPIQRHSLPFQEILEP